MHPQDPDLELWKRAQQKDEAAFDCLRAKYKPLVRGQLRKLRFGLQPTDLDDLEQEVWLAVWKNLPDFLGLSTFSTWVAGIAVNKGKESLRRKCTEERRVASLEREESRETPPAPEEQVLLHLLVFEALKKLPKKYQDVIHLYCVLQLTDEEIAQRLSLPLGTAKSRISAGKRKLKEMLEFEGDNEK
jgi:RNA polymerase sigma-70 factor (ECF subfamily)